MIGRQLKALRMNSKKSQTEVCTSLNIEQSTLANYENEKRIPKIDILIKIANYYNVSVDYLLGRTENQNASANCCLLETEQRNHNLNKQIIESTCQKEEKLLIAFRQLDDDNQDIIIGEIKKILKEQKYGEAALLMKKSHNTN